MYQLQRIPLSHTRTTALSTEQQDYKQKSSRLAATSTDCVPVCSQSGYPIVWSGHEVAAVEWSVSDALCSRSCAVARPPTALNSKSARPTRHCVRPSRFIRAQMFPTSYNSPRYIVLRSRRVFEKTTLNVAYTPVILTDFVSNRLLAIIFVYASTTQRLSLIHI